eukprot:111621-Amorphochlora_amoeboformis.AAC.1
MQIERALTAVTAVLAISVLFFALSSPSSLSLGISSQISRPAMTYRPGVSRRGPCVRPRGSITNFLPASMDYDALTNDLKEGETLDTMALEQPSSWDEYRMFMQETGGPAPPEENQGEKVLETAPVETKYGLNVLWLEKNIALAVDEIYPGNKRIPLTSFHLWPATDAWEDIKGLLETKSWISERDTINVLNDATEIITYWQVLVPFIPWISNAKREIWKLESGRYTVLARFLPSRPNLSDLIRTPQESHTTAEAREKFPEFFIRGTEQSEGNVMEGADVESLMSADGDVKAIDTSAIPRISLKEAAGFEALLASQKWYRDPEAEGPWDADSGTCICNKNEECDG